LGSVVGVLMSLSENDRRRVRYPAASSSRIYSIMSVPNLDRHGHITSGSTCVDVIEIKRTSFYGP
jgi:hypothetical protein